MDAGSVLDQYTSSLSNLPLELTFLLVELQEKDLLFYDHRKKLQQYDAQIHKFIKQQGSLAANPKEQQLYPKINTHFEECQKIQAEKCVLANSAALLVRKYLTDLEADLGQLEADGLLQYGDGDTRYDSEFGEGTPESFMLRDSRVSRKRKHGTTRGNTPREGSSHKRQRIEESEEEDLDDEDQDELEDEPEEVHIKAEESLSNIKISKLPTPHYHSSNGPGANGTPTKDGEDSTPYCFCQQVSFGDMVACDNSKCRYEWFHYKCVGLTKVPEGKWYCSDCTKRMKKRK